MHALCCVLGVGVCIACIVHCVYVYVVEEKELGVFQVSQPIRCAYIKERG